jgi:hypothetical protein
MQRVVDEFYALFLSGGEGARVEGGSVRRNKFMKTANNQP